VERAIAELARRQHGVVAHRQLIALGLGPDAIQHRIAVGRLNRIHLGVYAVGHTAPSREGRWMAAVLACGRGAALSHHSAAALWGIRESGRARVDVTVPARGRRPRRGIHLHCPRRIEPRDATARNGIPVTTPARTLFDLAAILSSTQLHRAFEAAERLELLNLAAIEDALARSRGRRGLRALKAVAEAYTPAPDVRSEAECLLVDLCRRSGLPLPATNVLVEGLLVDAFWPRHGLIVEVDGYEFHHTRQAFERDRERDAVLTLGGYRVIRVTCRRLLRKPAAVADTIRSLLAGG
jgi:Protein of unknown function (DUF559)